MSNSSQSIKQALNDLLIFILYLFSIFLFRTPLIKAIRSEYFAGDRYDPGLYVWLVKSNIENFFKWPSAGFDAPMFYPFGKALAYSDNYFFPSLLCKVFLFFTSEFVLSYNFSLLLAFLLNAYVTFCLVRYLVDNQWIAFVCGFVFLSLPFFAAHLGHPQIQFAFVLPGVLLQSLRFCRYRLKHNAFGIGLWVVIAFFSSVYYAFFCILLCALTLLSYSILRFDTIRLRDIWTLFFYNALSMLLLLFASLPYMAVRDAFGRRPLEEIKRLSIDLLSYISAPPGNQYWGALTHHFLHYEGHLFSGISTLIFASLALLLYSLPSKFLRLGKLAAIFLSLTIISTTLLKRFSDGVVTRDNHFTLLVLPYWLLMFVGISFLLVLAVYSFRRREDHSNPSKRRELTEIEYLAIFSFIAFFFLFTSLGIISGGKQYSGLFLVLHKWLPGFNALRAVGRFGIVSDLLIIVLAAYGLKRVISLSWFSKPVNAKALVIAYLFICAVELKHLRWPVGKSGKPSKVYKMLESIPRRENCAVVAIPMYTGGTGNMGYIHNQTEYMDWLQASTMPMVNGYSGNIPKFHQRLKSRLSKFPDENSLFNLSRMPELCYIVFNSKKERGFNQQKFEETLAKYSDQLKVLKRDEQGNYLIELTPKTGVRDTALHLLPSSKSRTLLFKIRYGASDKQQERKKITIATRLFPKETLVDESSFYLTADNTWQDFVISIPKSPDSVVPHILNMGIDNFSEEDVFYFRVESVYTD